MKGDDEGPEAEMSYDETLGLGDFVAGERDDPLAPPAGFTEWRRKGVANSLLTNGIKGFQGSVFLEVRESNRAALNFYKLHNFQEVSRRPEYYESPPETAIVMKLYSW